jgi:hypothetical protein
MYKNSGKSVFKIEFLLFIIILKQLKIFSIYLFFNYINYVQKKDGHNFLTSCPTSLNFCIISSASFNGTSFFKRQGALSTNSLA